MPQEAAHPNTQFVEGLEFVKFATPDTPVYTSQTSRHVPIFYWHTEQREAATAAGRISTFYADRPRLAASATAQSHSGRCTLYNSSSQSKTLSGVAMHYPLWRAAFML